MVQYYVSRVNCRVMHFMHVLPSACSAVSIFQAWAWVGGRGANEPPLAPASFCQRPRNTSRPTLEHSCVTLRVCGAPHSPRQCLSRVVMPCGAAPGAPPLSVSLTLYLCLIYTDRLSFQRSGSPLCALSCCV